MSAAWNAGVWLPGSNVRRKGNARGSRHAANPTLANAERPYPPRWPLGDICAPYGTMEYRHPDGRRPCRAPARPVPAPTARPAAPRAVGDPHVIGRTTAIGKPGNPEFHLPLSWCGLRPTSASIGCRFSLPKPERQTFTLCKAYSCRFDLSRQQLLQHAAPKHDLKGAIVH
jgi:hypothetical protein